MLRFKKSSQGSLSQLTGVYFYQKWSREQTRSTLLHSHEQTPERHRGKRRVPFGRRTRTFIDFETHCCTFVMWSLSNTVELWWVFSRCTFNGVSDSFVRTDVQVTLCFNLKKEKWDRHLNKYYILQFCVCERGHGPDAGTSVRNAHQWANVPVETWNIWPASGLQSSDPNPTKPHTEGTSFRRTLGDV